MESSHPIDLDAPPGGEHPRGARVPARHPFDRLRVRWLFAACVVTLVAAQISLNIAGGGSPTALSTMVVLLLSQVLVVVLLARRAGLQWRHVFGPTTLRDAMPLVMRAVPVNIVVIAMLISGASYLLYAPLARVAPRFVEHWLLAVPQAFVVDTPAQLARLVVLGVVFAPIVEEVLFRGILLQRWAHRWGTTTGVILSSALFALGHTEWIGHFVTGVLFAALYLRTRRLWVSIVTHALNNALAIVPAGLYELRHPSTSTGMTLAQLDAQLPSAALKLALGVVLLLMYVGLYWGDGVLRGALTGPLPYDVNASGGATAS